MEKKPQRQNQMNFKNWLETRAVSGEEWFYNKKTKRSEPAPVVFIRFGEIPEGNSRNHFLGQDEKGVSVIAAFYDRNTRKFILQSGGEQLLTTIDNITERPAYLVSGTPTEENGADGEQLLDRKSIKIIRKLKANEITTEQDPNFDLLGNEIKTSNVTFHNKNQDLKELRRKTFKIFNKMNLPPETTGYINRTTGDKEYLQIIIEPMEKEKEIEVYQAKEKAKKELKDVLGDFFLTMDYANSPRTEEHKTILFRIKSGKITI